MRTPNRWCLARAVLAMAVLATLTVGGTALAREPYQTVLTIPTMDCGGCARRVEAKLKEVRGVAGLKTDVQARTITVTPSAQTLLSPRALWEAVEKAGKQPTRLEGPSGAFTAKPQS